MDCLTATAITNLCVTSGNQPVITEPCWLGSGSMMIMWTVVVRNPVHCTFGRLFREDDIPIFL